MSSNPGLQFNKLLLFISTLLLASGCAKANFSGESGGSPGPNANDQCIGQNIDAITRMTKILFVVDTSGSNGYPTRDFGSDICYPGDSDYASCTPASDPNRSFRGGAIQNFFSTYNVKTNFQFAFETFAGTTAPVRDQWSGGTGGFQTALTSFKGFHDVVDNDATPYTAALTSARNAISSDSDLNSAALPNYDVVLITDGFPSDYIGNSMQTVASQFQSQIAQLQAVAPGRVYLSTIYYGQVQDPSAISLLKTMAQEGAGQFANVNDAATGITIDNVIPGSTMGCE